MPRTPVIAVSATSEIIRGARRVRVNHAYTSAVERAGAIPLVVPPLDDASGAVALLDRVDALVLTGGEDVDPRQYGDAPHPAAGAPHAERDATELALARAARDRRLPTLAICRGIQLLNVALGGTLVQDIPTECAGACDHDPRTPRDARAHDVVLVPGSRLAAALGTERLAVNSFHHQALRDVAPGLRVTATAPDGIIEGAEWDGDDWWALGVQWHPEELVGTPEPWDRALFAALARAAGARA